MHATRPASGGRGGGGAAAAAVPFPDPLSLACATVGGGRLRSCADRSQGVRWRSVLQSETQSTVTRRGPYTIV